jgi:hypothetical protein
MQHQFCCMTKKRRQQKRETVLIVETICRVTQKMFVKQQKGHNQISYVGP